jgi:hypothetical protein
MEIKRKGFVQAFGITLYCSLVGAFIWNGNAVFGKVPNYIGPVLFLLLFSVSALICALIVFYQPYRLFFDGKKKDAIDLVLATTGWLLFFFIIFLLLSLTLR